MKNKKVIVPLDEMVKTVVKAVVMDAEKYLLSQGLEKEVIRDIRQMTKSCSSNKRSLSRNSWL